MRRPSPRISSRCDTRSGEQPLPLRHAGGSAALPAAEAVDGGLHQPLGAGSGRVGRGYALGASAIGDSHESRTHELMLLGGDEEVTVKTATQTSCLNAPLFSASFLT